MINQQEKFVLSWLGKALEIECWLLLMLLFFIDPLRGRLFEWGWLQIVGVIYAVLRLSFSVWADKFLNAVKDVLESV
jgi:hypothetical protein